MQPLVEQDGLALWPTRTVSDEALLFCATITLPWRNQWRIQSWSPGGFPKVANCTSKWLVKIGASYGVTPLNKKNHGQGGVSGQPETPLDTRLGT